MLGEELGLAAKFLLGSRTVHEGLIELFQSIISLGLHLEVPDQLILFLLVQLDHSVDALSPEEFFIAELAFRRL